MKNNAKKNLLIVDDEKSILIAYTQLFSCDFINVDIAENAEQASLQLQKNTYDAIITDLELNMARKQDGILVIKKAKELHPAALLIMITAYGNDIIKDKMLQSGVDYYFEKPVSIKLIKSVLENNGFVFSDFDNKEKLRENVNVNYF